MSPVFRPLRLTRPKEQHFPSIRAVLEEDHHSHSMDLRPSHVFTIRHHPYGSRRSLELDDDDDIEGEGRLIYGIDSSFLIPDWIFEEAVSNSVFELQQEAEEQEWNPPFPLKETALKIVINKTFSFARKLFLNKPPQPQS